MSFKQRTPLIATPEELTLVLNAESSPPQVNNIINITTSKRHDIRPMIPGAATTA